MNILYIHQHFSTPQGSTGNRSYEMARRLVQCGHQVTMVCGRYHGGVTGLSNEFKRRKRRGNVDGINVIEFDLAYSNQVGFLKRSLIFLKFVCQSIGLVFTEKYDVLFATSTPLTVGIPGILARWLRRKLFVFEVRDLWPELPAAMGVINSRLLLNVLQCLEYVIYHSAHRLIGLSPGIVDGIAKRGIARERIAMISNGCDIDLFSKINQPWRPEGVSSSDLMAVYAGTHGLANGLSAVLDVALELKRRDRRDIKLVLVGQGMLKSSLQTRAQEERLDNVIFLEPVNKERLVGLMSASDLGLQILENIPAFYYGTSPNKFFDYIACGLPVLNNYPGWLAQMITRHDCGYVVPPAAPAIFADTLELAAEDRGRLVRMRSQAKILAEHEFNRAMLTVKFVGWLTFM